MLIKIQIVIGTLSVLLLFITFELIRKERLREEYSILWIFTGMAIFIVSLWPEFLLSQFFARITGLYYLSAVVLIVFLFLLLIVLHFSVVISDMKQMNRNLAQRQALLQLELDSLQKQLSPPARESS
jgi:hypothetical protein